MKISHLRKSYGKQIVLDDISIETAPGQIIGLVGNNGSGKTTLMKCMANLIVDYQGMITSDSSIAFMIENPSFYDGLSVQDNLRVFTALGGKGKADYTSVLKQVGLLEARDKKFKQLSLGMKQKLSIARMLLSESNIILLDEPFNGLDTLTKEHIKELIIMLRSQGKCVIVSSHILEELGEIADVIWYLRKGKIQKVFNLQDTYRIYRLVVKRVADVQKVVPSVYKILGCKHSENTLTIRVQIPSEDISLFLKLLIEQGVEVLEYYDSTNDIKELILEGENR